MKILVIIKICVSVQPPEYALVVQRIGRRIADPAMEVRFLPGAPKLF